MKLVPGSIAEPLNALEYEEFAKEYLSKNAYDYYASGADDMNTLQENRTAFRRLYIRPRVLRDMSNVQLQTTILGDRLDTPICVAPTAMHCMAHQDGELATARASARMNTCMILSSLSTSSIEDVASASGDGLRWFQLYVFKDREITKSLVKRAESAGYKAIVLTVDTPILGTREADVRNRFFLPSHLKLANFTNIGGDHAYGVKGKSNSGLAEYVDSLFDQSIDWKDVKWLKDITALPVVVKGILTSEDAKIAAELGCQGIIVSNHGARQLDGVHATIDALPEIVSAVRDTNVEIYMDGGIRRGTDILKALALGAKAVFVGRPIIWGLVHQGEEGAHNVLKILTNELRQAMLFSGARSISQISATHVQHKNSMLQSRI